MNTASAGPPGGSSTRRRKAPLKRFKPCFICKKVEGFTWTCGCGFAVCTPCLDEARRIGVIGDSHRSWICPDCDRENLFAKG